MVKYVDECQECFIVSSHFKSNWKYLLYLDLSLWHYAIKKLFDVINSHGLNSFNDVVPLSATLGTSAHTSVNGT